jgi:uncharacterized repeat protein (TIGR01451 family)
LVNRATVRGALADRVSSNNTDRAVATAGPRLVLRNTAARTSVRPGHAIAYTLVLRNAGPGTARRIVLCDTPGTGLHIARAPRAKRAHGRACWTFDTLGAGKSLRRHVIARVRRP